MSEMLNTFRQILKIGKKKDHSYYQLLSNLEADSWETYPRPQLKRKDWQCLNGIWKVKDKNIRVPFPPQAELSGYDAPAVGEIPEELLYERNFRLKEGLKKNRKDRILLHFGAADQIAQVFINGKPAAAHEGGYLPFSVDITDFLRPEGEDNLLSVFVQDHLDHKYPWGKQRKDRGGMWYTPCSGLWQTVWLEAVPEKYLEKVKITPLSLDKIRLEVQTSVPSCAAFYEIPLDEGKILKGQLIPDREKADWQSADIDLKAYNPHLWTPENPYLYPLFIRMEDDEIESYFGLRTCEFRRIKDKQWFCLNKKPLFLAGVLDQGYFCDGLFLPAAPEGYDQDIRNMKNLGFNLLRKHIKVEPERFYEACDRLGMLVMQDMVNNGPYSFIPDTGLPTIGVKIHKERSYSGGSRKERERKKFFLSHSKGIIDHLYNHPCVIAYTVFNEGWGQFAADRVGRQLQETDPTRIYDYTSGWFQTGNNPVESVHEYFHLKPYRQSDRPLFISECGGYTWKVPEHTYCMEDNYGYGRCGSKEELTDRILAMYEQMIFPSISSGLCGMIYTQVSDVEDEVNGFYTYDRMVCKVDPNAIRRANSRAERILEETVGLK